MAKLSVARVCLSEVALPCWGSLVLAWRCTAINGIHTACLHSYQLVCILILIFLQLAFGQGW